MIGASLIIPASIFDCWSHPGIPWPCGDQELDKNLWEPCNWGQGLWGPDSYTDAFLHANMQNIWIRRYVGKSIYIFYIHAHSVIHFWHVHMHISIPVWNPAIGAHTHTAITFTYAHMHTVTRACLPIEMHARNHTHVILLAFWLYSFSLFTFTNPLLNNERTYHGYLVRWAIRNMPLEKLYEIYETSHTGGWHLRKPWQRSRSMFWSVM